MPTLTWLTRDDDLKRAAAAPYRLLEAVPELSAGDSASGNMLIQGDNLDALKALLPYYAGQVRCIYIDPPFGTGREFDEYDDNLKHSIWLSMMYPRLIILAEMLHKEGSIFVHLDDNETDYARVILDQIFGRQNFVARITVKARSPSAFSTVNPGVFKSAEYILWYSKSKSEFWQDRVWVPRAPDTAYNKWLDNPDDPESDWRLIPLGPQLQAALIAGGSRTNVERATKSFYVSNANRIIRLAEIDDDGAGEDIVEVKRKSIISRNKIFRHKRVGYDDIFVTSGQQILFYSKNVRTVDGELTPARMLTNIWDDIAWEGIAREGGVTLKRGKKPERLLRRCLQLTTRPGDLVLDSFLGSGTTAAVAAKMRRRFIGIERGEQAKTHCHVRLDNVVKGEQSGVSSLEGWKGGGGFKFYRLGAPVFGEDGRINDGISFAHLAAHIWFSESGVPMAGAAASPWLGAIGGRGLALLYNGILGDKSVSGGNVLTAPLLKRIRDESGGWVGPITIYGEASRLGAARLQAEGVTFKQTPYDVRAR